MEWGTTPRFMRRNCFQHLTLSVPVDRVDAPISTRYPALAMSLLRISFKMIPPGCLAARGRRVVGVDRMDGIDGMDLGGGE